MPSPRSASQPPVDLAAPLYPQVGAMAEGYDRWVHDSVSRQAARNAQVAAGRVDPKWPDSLRLFRSDFMERMSHIPWWLVLVVWVPIVAGLAVLAVSAFGHGAASLLAWMLAGFAMWTLAEYLLHRFVFHYKPKTAFGRHLHFLAHGIHHLDPWDPTRLVFPPLAGLLFAAGLFGVLWSIFPLQDAVPAMAGLLVGYLVYDMTHYYTHHAKPRSRWGRFLKAWHLEHHHRAWERMYGVSSPLWDWVFRTGRPPRPAPPGEGPAR